MTYLKALFNDNKEKILVKELIRIGRKKDLAKIEKFQIINYFNEKVIFDLEKTPKNQKSKSKQKYDFSNIKTFGKHNFLTSLIYNQVSFYFLFLSLYYWV